MKTVDFGNGEDTARGTFDISKGYVLITGRWAEQYKPTMIYEVLAEIPAPEFFKHMNVYCGRMQSYKISDLLVNAFDESVAERKAKDFGLSKNKRLKSEGCLYVFKTAGRKYIHQHST